ncbi:Hypothetical Protein FCC1311_047372 [Hondaea fermentalgiana]|uniref:Phosphorylated adapter RNA export protein RNA-binding domain-containing protein n=1 Tax=Hondaea fermentalgiana TaxID=2315210 RepID=A0A2R5GKW9_9STRA|nr:Hypothetical Protein FCC1311_047372 [Hondaea fermentalgiana]|eukprot:GBG28514.1 Hypothetical Protein FCC1311_047372 [Hondaea fermentalgiana]
MSETKAPEETPAAAAAAAEAPAAEAKAPEATKGTKRVAAAEAGDEGALSPELEALKKRICEELEESNAFLVQLILEQVGLEDGEKLLAKTHEVVKSEEGIKTADGERRKTPGGVYFHLARDQLGAGKFNVLTHRVRKQRRLDKKSAEEAAKPAEEAAKPAEETAKPAEEAAKPAEDETKPAAAEEAAADAAAGATASKDEEEKKA